ncbi:hypothetical protein RN001_001152 [Aquatica leii]|uniref:Uncharacterized protein n=1 Tax=Aquatica leii TaxID=1421715 RepID=A0AAN7SCK9_9COLE|nr:hypothetical protein RN001_001152 [Aquatica leii]
MRVTLHDDGEMYQMLNNHLFNDIEDGDDDVEKVETYRRPLLPFTCTFPLYGVLRDFEYVTYCTRTSKNKERSAEKITE